MYKKIYVDLYTNNPTTYGTDNEVLHTIDLDNIEDPESDDDVRSAIIDIYSRMKKAGNRVFMSIQVNGIPDGDDDEEELFKVNKKELVEHYGINILEYASVWTGHNVCV